MRKCLVIAYYFPPMGLSGVQRTLKFVKYLREYNWEPIVLTTSNEDYYAYDDSLMNELEAMDIEVYRTKDKQIGKKKSGNLPNYQIQKLGRFFLNFFNIPDSKIKWKKIAEKTAQKVFKEHEIDVIFATAPPFTDFLIAKELSDKNNVPYVIDYRDSWTDNQFHYFPTPFHKSKSIKLENELLRTSASAIVISRHAKEMLLKRYKFLSYDDVVIIPHGYDSEDFEESKHIGVDKNSFVITHSGVFQDNRTPKYFFKAIQKLIKKNPEISKYLKVRLVGMMRKSHIKMITRYKLENIVSTVGFVNHKESVNYLFSSDVLWLMLNDDIRTPGKLWEYFGSKKPIIATIPDGSMKQLSNQYKASISTNPKDVEEISLAIEKLYELWKKNLLPKPDDAFVNQFDRKLLTGNLAKQLSSAININ